MTIWEPSAGPAFRTSMTMRPPAPGRFSTTTGWPSETRILSATRRVMVSRLAPAGKPTRILRGAFCAPASCEMLRKTARTRPKPRRSPIGGMVAFRAMKPPFRADQVGSLLRPKALAEARQRWKQGRLEGTALREIEDRAIEEAVARQEAVGLESITDGEFRRDWWHLDFLSQLDGVALRDMTGPRFGGSDEQPPIP